ncbi:unnamed protein product [Linum tenue]|uniref:Protein kinase domain-containing protein n=1 Tax=Linum tenue TaxID=586396 RepID=A0AAV0R183_9ROSI|nr:unnamed protein product [Linum tenue]
MNSNILRDSDFDTLLSYNRQIPNKDSVQQDTNAVVNVTVNCSCGDSSISRGYGLFVTYPLRQGDNLESIARGSNVSAELLQQYNAGISIAAVAVVLLLAVFVYVKFYRKKKTGITVDKSVEFSYEELAKATDDFSLANKIGAGGFGAVYYAELRGEFIENGNLSQHLRGTAEREPLTWPGRVQIALNSARGLEYIHEHTVPVYIHRDIKSANILIDKNYRAKVADFGLTKLTEFEDVLDHPDPEEDIRKLVDPRLGDNYPLDSVRKMAQLAKACTQENPQLRPSMRSIVVALMTLSSSTEDWDVGSFYDNQALVNLMSGR